MSFLGWTRLLGDNVDVLFISFSRASLTPVQMVHQEHIAHGRLPGKAPVRPARKDRRGNYPVERYLMGCPVSS